MGSKLRPKSYNSLVDRAKSLASLKVAVSFLAGTYHDSSSLFFLSDSMGMTSVCHRAWSPHHLQKSSPTSLPFDLLLYLGLLTIRRTHWAFSHGSAFAQAVPLLAMPPPLPPPHSCLSSSLTPPRSSPSGKMKGSFLACRITSVPAVEYSHGYLLEVKDKCLLNCKHKKYLSITYFTSFTHQNCLTEKFKL